LTSPSTRTAAYPQGIYKFDFVRRLSRWFDDTPHPPLAVEISPGQVAGVRFTRSGAVGGYALENIPQGTVVPSAIETNLLNPNALKAAVSMICQTLGAKDEDVALLVPDPVIRVFVQHFSDFPRSAQEAIPMLRWKLKKSVPFEVDETLVSYMRQTPRADGVDIVTAIARLRIIREYESLFDGLTLRPGVVLSSTLAAITLVDDLRPTLLARVSGTCLTTSIIREGVLAGYRCTELPSPTEEITPQMLLEEVFPLAAYYQDTWQEDIQAVRIAGLGSRLPDFLRPFEDEFKCDVRSLLHAAISEGRAGEDAHPLADRELDGLVGWMLHRR
jgi:type IV pilus assembly protein PilM